MHFFFFGPGNASLLQAAANMVTQPASVQSSGIFLLNLAANSNTNLAMSQLGRQNTVCGSLVYSLYIYLKNVLSQLENFV